MAANSDCARVDPATRLEDSAFPRVCVSRLPTRSFPAAPTRMPRATISIPEMAPRFIVAVGAVTSGMSTATSSSSTAWGCARSRWGTPIPP